MALFGLTPEDVETAVELWPENVRPVEVFIGLKTQWRVAHCGRTGLDYPALPITFRLMGIPRKEWPDLFEALQVLEAAALDEMYKDK